MCTRMMPLRSTVSNHGGLIDYLERKAKRRCTASTHGIYMEWSGAAAGEWRGGVAPPRESSAAAGELRHRGRVLPPRESGAARLP